MAEERKAFTDVPPLQIIAGDTVPTIYFDIDSTSGLTADVLIVEQNLPGVIVETVACSDCETGFCCEIPCTVTENLNGSYWYILEITDTATDKIYRRARGALDVCAAPKGGGSDG